MPGRIIDLIVAQKAFSIDAPATQVAYTETLNHIVEYINGRVNAKDSRGSFRSQANKCDGAKSRRTLDEIDPMRILLRVSTEICIVRYATL